MLQILEECGYDVPLDRIHPVTSYLSGKLGQLHGSSIEAACRAWRGGGWPSSE
jgi:hypothetical protein